MEWLEVRSLRGTRGSEEIKHVLAGVPYEPRFPRKGVSVFTDPTETEKEFDYSRLELDPQERGMTGKAAAYAGHKTPEEMQYLRRFIDDPEETGKGYLKGYLMGLDIPSEKMHRAYQPDQPVPKDRPSIGMASEIRPEYVKTLRRIKGSKVGKERDIEKFRDTYRRLFGEL